MATEKSLTVDVVDVQAKYITATEKSLTVDVVDVQAKYIMGTEKSLPVDVVDVQAKYIMATKKSLTDLDPEHGFNSFRTQNFHHGTKTQYLLILALLKLEIYLTGLVLLPSKRREFFFALYEYQCTEG